MMRAFRFGRLLALGALMTSLLILTFGTGTGIAVAQGASASVAIQNFAFSPGSIQVDAGTTVTWTNNDQVMHTVTADDGSFDSGDIAPGGTFSMTFNTPGTFSYHCKIHPFMTASIVVMAAQQSNQPAAAAATTAPVATQAPAATGNTTAQTTVTTMPVTGSGYSPSPASHSNGLTALVLALVSIALGVLAAFRGVRRR
jgi:plastocyanin